jgi:uncharacterized membrane protein
MQPMSKVEAFLTAAEEQEIVQAIGIAEKKTSGEIRVHIEKTTAIDPYDRAKAVFLQLNMHETELKNGVLIYLAVTDKKFAICGDKGINDIVGANFWDSTRDCMMVHFKNGNFKQGLIDGVLKAGEQLQEHFPHQTRDRNELSNEISKS